MKTMSKIENICRKAKEASRLLAQTTASVRNRALIDMASELINKADIILRANDRDVRAARKKNMPEALIDRLTLNRERIKAMSISLLEITRLKDPVGEVIETIKRPNGLLIKKVRVPIGVILIIYESRPNVTSDCAALCIKSGNAVILRGASDAINTNCAIFDALNAVSQKHGIPKGSITMIKETDRKLMDDLLAQDGLIDLVIPRGGEGLIRYVAARSRMPVIKHYKGVCHIFVDQGADLKMAEEICFNAKVERPGVCNAMETMLVHEKIAKKFLPSMLKRFENAGVEIRGDGRISRIFSGINRASEADWYTEYLDLILSVKVVKDVGEAIRHIMKYGSYHSDAIVTRNVKNAEKFLREVDSACVYVNASTRFTDGGQFGKGAEMGISTDKIHVRGPMGLEELESYKYIVYGNGQIRK